MSTFSGVWVQAPEGPVLLRKRVQKFGRTSEFVRGVWDLRYSAGCQWILAECPDEMALSGLAKQLSVQTTAIGVAFQSVVDAFMFCLYRDGVEHRTLRCGVVGPEERTWEVARGRAEPWEESVLWAGAAEEIQTLADFVGSEELASFKVALERREIRIGSHFPSVDARGATWSLLKSYGVESEWPERLRLGPPWPLRLLPFLW